MTDKRNNYADDDDDDDDVLMCIAFGLLQRRRTQAVRPAMAFEKRRRDLIAAHTLTLPYVPQSAQNDQAREIDMTPKKNVCMQPKYPPQSVCVRALAREFTYIFITSRVVAIFATTL